jgi:DNA-directed DNA polymerase III PolC
MVVFGQNSNALSILKRHGFSTYFELIFDGGVAQDRSYEYLRSRDSVGLPLVASNAVRFESAGDIELYRMLRAIDHNVALESLDESMMDHISASAYLKTAAEMAVSYKEYPDAIQNTHHIADQCDFKLTLGKWRFPKVSHSRPMKKLARLAVKGLRNRLPGWNSQHVSRLRYELRQIRKLNFTDYFLIVWDIASYARKNRIPSLGRGSAANSLVSFCLGLTHVDPIEHDLYFERFINPSRKTPPDVDLDFCWKRREKVLEYVFNKYGHRHVAMICTTVTMGLRSAFREIGRVMGLDEKELSSVSKRLPYVSEIPENYNDLIKRYPGCKGVPLNEEPYKSIYILARKIQNFPRHLSVHPGGIIITDSEINRYVAQQRSANGLIVTQYDMYDIEALGLVKIDLLGNRSLSVYQDCADVLNGHGIQIPGFDQLSVVFQNSHVQSLICSGGTIGCFYIESPAMRQLLQKLHTQTFGELTAASSVIRPGVAESGMMNQFIERSLDNQTAVYLHPLMKHLLEDTHGVMIYQEDVLKVAHHLAGMSLADADLFRRAMSGKGRSKAAMRRLVDAFVNGCVGNGVDPKVAVEIWRQVQSFAGYSFCKAHSASYAQLSFLTAYLKVYFPALFMASVINNGGGFYGAQVYVSEAKRLGINVSLPCVNKSEMAFSGWSGELRIGLSQISHISRIVKERLIAERHASGAFKSLGDLLQRVRLSMRDAEILISCGACDCFDEERTALLLQLTVMHDRLPVLNATHSGSHVESLFPMTSPGASINASFVDPLSVRQRLRYEVDYLDMMVTWHPVEWVQVIRSCEKWVGSGQLSNFIGKQVKIVGWCIAAKSCRAKKTGAQMKFMSMEDTFGTFEVTVFPKIYSELAPITYGRGPFLIDGRCDSQFGVVSIIATNIVRLDLDI